MLFFVGEGCIGVLVLWYVFACVVSTDKGAICCRFCQLGLPSLLLSGLWYRLLPVPWWSVFLVLFRSIIRCKVPTRLFSFYVYDGFFLFNRSVIDGRNETSLRFWIACTCAAFLWLVYVINVLRYVLSCGSCNFRKFVR